MRISVTTALRIVSIIPTDNPWPVWGHLRSWVKESGKREKRIIFCEEKTRTTKLSTDTAGQSAELSTGHYVSLKKKLPLFLLFFFFNWRLKKTSVVLSPLEILILSWNSSSYTSLALRIRTCTTKTVLQEPRRTCRFRTQRRHSGQSLPG